MQLLHFFLLYWILITVGALEFGNLDTIPSGDASHDFTLFNDANVVDQPTESPSNLFLDDNDQSRLNTQLASDLSFNDNGVWPADVLLADSGNANQPVDTNLEWVLNGFDDCFGSADDPQLFGKVRRGESCRTPPVGQADIPDQPKEGSNSPNHDVPDVNPYTSVLARALQRNLEICPIMVFGLSNIPVCKGLDETEDFRLVGPNLYDIQYVIPCTSLHHRVYFYRLRARQQKLILFVKGWRSVARLGRPFFVADIS